MKKIILTAVLAALLFNCKAPEKNEYNKNEIIFVVEMESNENYLNNIADQNQQDFRFRFSSAQAAILLLRTFTVASSPFFPFDHWMHWIENSRFQEISYTRLWKWKVKTRRNS